MITNSSKFSEFVEYMNYTVILLCPSERQSKKLINIFVNFTIIWTEQIYGHTRDYRTYCRLPCSLSHVSRDHCFQMERDCVIYLFWVIYVLILSPTALILFLVCWKLTSTTDGLPRLIITSTVIQFVLKDVYFYFIFDASYDTMFRWSIFFMNLISIH